MGSKLFVGGCLVAAALCFHVVVNPLLAASSVKAAFDNGEGDKLASMIDFPALREDLKADADAALSKGDPVARALGGALVTGMIDSFLKPEAVAGLLDKKAAAAEGNTKDDHSPDYSLGFGLTEFMVTIEMEDGPISVVFAPRGLTWKIVGADADLAALSETRF